MRVVRGRAAACRYRRHEAAARADGNLIVTMRYEHYKKHLRFEPLNVLVTIKLSCLLDFKYCCSIDIPNTVQICLIKNIP